MSTSDLRIRQEQVEFGRRATLGLSEPRRDYRTRAPFEAPRKFVAKGHDAVLKALQDGGRKTTIVTLAGEEFTGTIFGRDKFTITLLVDGKRRVFYKHAIEQFYGEEATDVTVQ